MQHPMVRVRCSASSGSISLIQDQSTGAPVFVAYMAKTDLSEDLSSARYTHTRSIEQLPKYPRWSK